VLTRLEGYFSVEIQWETASQIKLVSGAKVGSKQSFSRLGQRF
jgi:hypothetical protein